MIKDVTVSILHPMAKLEWEAQIIPEKFLKVRLELEIRTSGGRMRIDPLARSLEVPSVLP